MPETDSSVRERARKKQKYVMENALMAMRSVLMNASQKDEGPTTRESVLKAMLQNAFLTNIPVEKNVMMECSSVGTNATLTIIKPGTDIENAMESAFPNRSNAMELVPIVSSRVEKTAAGK